MKRLLLILALAAPMAAQDVADLAVTLDVTSMPARPRPGDTIAWTATVTNNGPATATNVHLESGLLSVPCVLDTIPRLAAGERKSVACSVVVPRLLYEVLYVAGYSIEQDDPDGTNNRIDRPLDLETPPDLYVESFPPNVVDAALPYTLQIFYSNLATTPATGVVITIELPEVAGILSKPDFCAAAGTTLTCTIGELTQGSYRTIGLELLAPDASARTLPVRATIRANEEDLRPESNVLDKATRTYRTWFVTNAADEGGGSLRDAIHSANAGCIDEVPCKIAFRIPMAAAKWATIEPRTPLPVLDRVVIVDGLMQVAYIGDTNPEGPEVEISGARLTAGNGLSSQCSMTVRNLTINGFPGSGIQVGAGSTCRGGSLPGFDAPAIEDNHIGTDPTGSRAVPNERGIVFDPGSAGIRRNVISGNRRSGVFVARGAAFITNNVIGLDRLRTKDLGNGASGVYLGNSHGSDVIDNYIGFNRHFGVSIDRNAAYTSVRGNSFQANWSLAIDYGLDGPTQEVPDASTSAPVRRPAILRAWYDPELDQTTVQGFSETSRERHAVWVAIYSNDEPDPSGYGEGQYYLGEVQADDRDGYFSFVYRGRAPGNWIAATSTRQNIIGLARTPEVQGICGCGYTTQTSEFSRTVAIQ